MFHSYVNVYRAGYLRWESRIRCWWYLVAGDHCWWHLAVRLCTLERLKFLFPEDAIKKEVSTRFYQQHLQTILDQHDFSFWFNSQQQHPPQQHTATMRRTKTRVKLCDFSLKIRWPKI